MKYLLFQSDDYGISHGVSDGILYAIKNGVVRNTGLFVNMPSSEESAEKIKNINNIDVGIDINYVAGFPVSSKELVHGMIDENGHFISSTKQMKNNMLYILIKKLNFMKEEASDKFYEQLRRRYLTLKHGLCKKCYLNTKLL